MTSPEAPEIARRVEGYLEQLTTVRDVEAVRDYFTPDVRFLGPGVDMDRSQIIEELRAAFDAGVGIRVDRRTLELFSHGDVAYEIAEADDTLVLAGGTEQVLRNRHFIRWEKGADGFWRFSHVLMSPRGLPTNEAESDG